jgi:hypothetical protein
MAKKTTWEKTPRLHVAFGPMIERIKHLTSHGLSVMMVLYDILSMRTGLDVHGRGRHHTAGAWT